MKRVLLFVFPLVAALVISAAVLAQDGNLVGRFAPFVMDVEQAVPVVVSMLVDVGDGDVMTATVPLTVSVALQVRVDGAGATIVAEDAPEPVVAVRDVENGTVDTLGIPYIVLSGDSDIKLSEWEVYADNAKDWKVAGKLTNLSNTQRFGWVDVVVHFYREDDSVLSINTLRAGGGGPSQVIQIASKLEPTMILTKLHPMTF